MDYTVIAVKALTVQKQGSQNFGKKYVECTVRDTQGNERVVPVFDAEANKFLKYIGVNNGGTSQTGDQPIPEADAKWSYAFDQEFVFPEPMVRVDGVSGKPLINKFKQMYVRTSVRVLTRYVYDEQLQLLNPGGPALSPLRGWDLSTRGTSVMNSFYLPKRLFEAQGPATQQVDDNGVA
jgi:hypothetical protein